MRITLPLIFLGTLGLTRTENQIIKDFSDCLLNVFKIFAQTDQPVVWKNLLSNTGFEVSHIPNAIQSNGVVVSLGVEKIQELMTLTPQALVDTIKQILENNAKIALSEIFGHPFTPLTLEAANSKQLPSNQKFLDKIHEKFLEKVRHQQAYHAIEHGWFNETIAYQPTPSDKFIQALDLSWDGQQFDDILDYYVNAFVEITDHYELSGSFQLLFFFGQMIEKLFTVAPPQMLDSSGSLSVECISDIVKSLCSHPKMPKYGIEAVKEVQINNSVTPKHFLKKNHTKYFEMKTIKTQLWVDHDTFWLKLRTHFNAKIPLDQKNTLIEIIKNHYTSPKHPLTERCIGILSQSPYVLKQLFDAGVITTQNNQNENFVDANEKKYFMYNFDKRFSVKEKTFEFLSLENNHLDEEWQSAQDLLDIFQRATLSEHVGETSKTAKRKM